MITVTLGIPASGKSRTKKREVARLIRSGRKVLWLTPLKTEVDRVAREFIQLHGIHPSKVYTIPSKIEVCPALRNMKDFYHVIIGIATCMVCKHQTCVFKSFIRSAISKDEEGLYIATHKFLWLSLFFKHVYIDEADYLVPSMFELVPAKKVDIVLRAIAKVFGEEVADTIRRKYLVPISEEYFLFKGTYPFKYFYNHRELTLISATMQYGSDIMAAMLGFNSSVDLEEAVNEGMLKLYPDIKPTPEHKKDFFYLYRYRLYWMSPHTRRMYINLKYRVAKDVKEGYTVTIVARSNREARIIRNFLVSGGDKDILVENLNWSMKNFDEWRRHQVRIIVIRGRFHRALDIESDKIYAFYQHLRPEDKAEMAQKLYPIWGALTDEIIRFDEYRAHIQTIFRCARSWTNRHEFYLLDSKYEHAFMYFDHIYDYFRRKVTVIDDLKSG